MLYHDLHIAKNLHTKKCFQRGYVLLFSVLIAGIVLVMGISILNTARKGVILSATSRESQFAFYAADAAIECALYWDQKHEGFPVTVFGTSTSYTGTSGSSIWCVDSGQPLDPIGNSGPDAGGGWITEFTLFFPDGSCAEVSMLKENDGRKTTLESFGRNTCDLSAPRRVERAIRATY